MERSISSLELPNSLKDKLLACGFQTVGELKGFKIAELAKEAKISVIDSNAVFKSFQKQDTPLLQNAKSALELLDEEQQNDCPIISFSQNIDGMLGGGIPLRKITEFCGVPGIGKTQMGIQLAIDSTIPVENGGVGGECIYIDTEGSFVVDRVNEIAEAVVLHVENPNYTTKEILSSIHYYRIHDYIEQIALIHTLPEFLNKNPKVKLVVIDSITFHFRYHFDDMSIRTRLLNGMAQSLMSLAQKYGIAVVLINQVTTKIDEKPGMNGNNTHLAPALGESWAHNCTNRVILYWKNGQRLAYLSKSPQLEAATVPFMVGLDGIRNGDELME